MRAALWLFGLYVASERVIPHPCHFEEARNGWAEMPLQYKDELAFKLVGVWERWDACWYARIATVGYTPDGSTAFFPLFPALERTVAVAGPHVAIAGMVVNVVATVLALWGLYRLAADDHGEVVARRTMLLLAIFPTAFFLLAPFSEAVFLALGVWSIERARRGEWGTAALLATLIGLSRPVGGTIALPLAWLAWRQLRHAPRAADRIWPAVATLAAPVSAALYVVYTIRVVGRSMFQASAEWTGSAFHPPWDLIGATLDWVRRTGDPLQALQLAMLIVFAALFAVGVRRLPVELTLYAAPQLYLAWARILPTPLTSVGRYLLVIFPMFIVLALLLGDRRARWSYVILSLLLLGALANEFVIGNFIG
ncbi:MAG: hypothetical protein HYU87_00950 [Chloroflexi bacterium]|nr:hypothetical protein [Chloroflexota bacterium]